MLQKDRKELEPDRKQLEEDRNGLQAHEKEMEAGLYPRLSTLTQYPQGFPVFEQQTSLHL